LLRFYLLLHHPLLCGADRLVVVRIGVLGLLGASAFQSGVCYGARNIETRFYSGLPAAGDKVVKSKSYWFAWQTTQVVAMWSGGMSE
jgi:hypothetical protein